MTRQTHQRFYRRRRIAAVVLLGLATLVVVCTFGIFGTQPSTALQGDQLGPDGSESAAEYSERAEASLARADEPAYALVGFHKAVSPSDADEVLRPVQRMDAIIIGLAAPVAVPEPIAGTDRADVIETVLERVADSAGAIGEDAPSAVDAAVVYAGGSELRALAADPRVETVEVAPADAAWGSFGVRPPSNVRTMITSGRSEEH